MSDCTPISVLINNVGGHANDKEYTAFYRKTSENIDYDLNVNLDSALFMTNLFIEDMVERNKGRILTVSSVASNGIVFLSTYSLAKAAILTWVKTVARELIYINSKVQIAATITGYVHTPATEKVNSVVFLAETSEEYVEKELNMYGTSEILTGSEKHLLMHVVTSFALNVLPAFLQNKITGFNVETMRNTGNVSVVL